MDRTTPDIDLTANLTDIGHVRGVLESRMHDGRIGLELKKKTRAGQTHIVQSGVRGRSRPTALLGLDSSPGFIISTLFAAQTAAVDSSPLAPSWEQHIPRSASIPSRILPICPSPSQGAGVSYYIYD